MKNRIIIRALALFSALTLCVCCLVSCDFNNPLRETYEEPKQLVGVENLTEEEIQTANMISEKVEKFYALYAEETNKEVFFERMKEIFYISMDAFKVGASKDWLEIFQGISNSADFEATVDYEEVSCVSIVVRGDTAEVIIKVLFNDKTEGYYKTELVFRNEEWFLVSFPGAVNYTPAS